MVFHGLSHGTAPVFELQQYARSQTYTTVHNLLMRSLCHKRVTLPCCFKKFPGRSWRICNTPCMNLLFTACPISPPARSCCICYEFPVTSLTKHSNRWFSFSQSSVFISSFPPVRCFSCLYIFSLFLFPYVQFPFSHCSLNLLWMCIN